MGAIAAADVKKLRDLTAAGMMECKKALEESGGDFDKAIENVSQPRIYRKLYWKSASVRGFQNQSFPEFFDEAAARILSLYYAGRLRPLTDPTPFTGLEHAADAVEYLLSGRNLGKVIVKL